MTFHDYSGVGCETSEGEASAARDEALFAMALFITQTRIYRPIVMRTAATA